MYITINRKRQYFGKNLNFSEFIEYFKRNSLLLFNFENANILIEFKKIYDSLVPGNERIEFKHIRSYVNKHFGFVCLQNVDNGFRERGFSEEEIEEMHKNKVKEYINKNGYIVLKTQVYETIKKEYPICPLCGSELDYTFVEKTGVMWYPKCKNEECETNKKTSEYMKYIFGDECYNDFYKNKRKANRLCPEYWLTKGFSDEEAKNKISELQSNSSKQVKHRRSVKKGEMPDEFFRGRSWRCKEYWLKNGYDYNEAEEEISKRQSTIASKNKHSYFTPQNKEYWTNKGYEESEALKMVSEIQSTFSLEKCVEKYGYLNGEKIWRERQEKWQETLHKNGNFHVGFSLVSQELFDNILKNYPQDKKDYVFYGSKNREYSLWCDAKKHAYVYDFTDLDKRKIIEFNGDIYHANPEIYEENDHPNPFKKNVTSKEIWAIDEYKKELAQKNGFDVLFIWEKDYRINPDKCLDECLRFLSYE